MSSLAHPATRAMVLREAVSSTRMDRDQTINLGPPGDQMTQTNYAVPAGDYITEWCQEHEVSHAELEYTLGVSPSYLDALLAGEIALSDDVARALERLSGIPVTSWQRLDAQHWTDKARLAARRASDFSVTLSRHLRDYMAEHDLTVEQVATQMGHSPDFVEEHTSGLRSPDTDLLDAVAQLAGTDIRSLMQTLMGRMGDAWPTPGRPAQ
jgi:plasmid maintenance system antidote protein VapI